MSEPRSLSPFEAFKLRLEQLRDRISSALPQGVSVDKFIKQAELHVQQSPKLLDCTPSLLLAEILKCASTGLMPDGREAAIIPYGQRARFTAMIQGILKLIRNSGEVSTIMVEVVHEKDDFEFYRDDQGPHIKHRPDPFADDRGAPRGVYMLALMKDGTRFVELMSKSQVMDVRNVSKGQGTPWDGPFALEMWKKSVVRRGSKWLPMSTDMQIAISADDEAFADTKTEPEIEAPKPSSRLAALMTAPEPAMAQEDVDIPL